MDELIAFDKSLLLSWNGSDSLFLDGFMWMYSSTWMWVPLALYLLFLFFSNNDIRNVIVLLVLVALLFVASDRISSGLIKPFFLRLRPTHDPEIGTFIDTVRNYRGGMYGFVSSHSANAFAIWSFTALLFKNYAYSLVMLLWALLLGYSRIYLGVHFPGDVFCGALLGIAIGVIFYRVYVFLSSKLSVPMGDGHGNRYSKEITPSGYSKKQLHGFLSLFFLLNIVAFVAGLLVDK